MKTSWMIYRELELLPDSVPEPKTSKLSIPLWLLRFWRWFFVAYSKRPEPMIRQVEDNDGHICWRVYDPATGREAYLESESEIWIWLEKLAY